MDSTIQSERRLAFHLQTHKMFVRQPFWFGRPPEFTPEFKAWLIETFGDRCWISYTGKNIRSSGDGNRGGWEYKLSHVIFEFDSHADALLFRMEWGPGSPAMLG